MQPPCSLDPVEFALEAGDALADQAAVDFELALARPAEKTKTAALALEMGPRSNQPGALVGERGQLNLQAALMGARPRAKNLQDQTCAVDDLCLPASFQITLLHRAQHAIDDNQTDAVTANHRADVFEGATSEQAAWPRTGNPGDLGTDHIEVYRTREADRFFQPSVDRTARDFCRLSARRQFQCWMDD